MAIKDLLVSDDPLSEEAIQMLIKYREEDLYVDYKESFDCSDKEWLGMTKDIMAFANTHGGYLVLGVRSTPFEIIGVLDPIAKTLGDVNIILQKANRYVGPAFASLRSKKFKIDKDNIVVIYVPESKGRTHIVIKEAKCKYQDGGTNTLLRPGMIYMRRSGTNQIITPDDMELILTKRIDFYKDSLFEKISRVVRAPIEHELILRDVQAKKQDDVKKVKFSNDKDAIPVKGLSFTVPPKTNEEEISGWIAFKQRDSGFCPGAARLWYMYSQRSALKDTISTEQAKELMRFNLEQRIPAFYWMKRLDNETRKGVIKEAFEAAKSIDLKIDILHVSSFEGRTFYRLLLKKLGKDNIERLNPRSRKYPDEGPCSFYHQLWLPTDGKGLKKTVKEKGLLEERLSSLSVKFSCSTGTNEERWEAIAIDCYLYNMDNKKE